MFDGLCVRGDCTVGVDAERYSDCEELNCTE